MAGFRVKAAQRRHELLFAQAAQPQLRPEPQRRGGCGDHRRGSGGAAGSDNREHLDGIRAAAIDIIDHDQPRRRRNQIPGRAVEIQRPRLAAQQPIGQAVRRADIAQ
jgi:hypothetical protein